MIVLALFVSSTPITVSTYHATIVNYYYTLQFMLSVKDIVVVYMYFY